MTKGKAMGRFSIWFVLFGLTVSCTAQDDIGTQNGSYQHCLNAMKQTPQDAYEPCKAYVARYPSGDDRSLKFVQRWLAAYDKLQPYIQFLRNLAPKDYKASWFIYEPDLGIELPQTFDSLGPYKVEMVRSFTGTYEESLLKKAEAVYSSPHEMIEEVFQKLAYLGDDPPREMAPLWGVRGNDNLPDTSIVTARAVRFYYDLVQAAKQNPHLPTGFTALNIGLKYQASIKFLENYTHKQDTFTKVYVADLTLEWAFSCGGLCGMGFTRNKIVVLDSNGNVLAMYLDAPVNSQSWVS